MKHSRMDYRTGMSHVFQAGPPPQPPSQHHQQSMETSSLASSAAAAGLWADMAARLAAASSSSAGGEQFANANSLNAHHGRVHPGHPAGPDRHPDLHQHHREVMANAAAAAAAGLVRPHWSLGNLLSRQQLGSPSAGDSNQSGEGSTFDRQDYFAMAAAAASRNTSYHQQHHQQQQQPQQQQQTYSEEHFRLQSLHQGWDSRYQQRSAYWDHQHASHAANSHHHTAESLEQSSASAAPDSSPVHQSSQLSQQQHRQPVPAHVPLPAHLPQVDRSIRSGGAGTSLNPPDVASRLSQDYGQPQLPHMYPPDAIAPPNRHVPTDTQRQSLPQMARIGETSMANLPSHLTRNPYQPVANYHSLPPPPHSAGQSSYGDPYAMTAHRRNDWNHAQSSWSSSSAGSGGGLGEKQARSNSESIASSFSAASLASQPDCQQQRQRSDVSSGAQLKVNSSANADAYLYQRQQQSRLHQQQLHLHQQQQNQEHIYRQPTSHPAKSAEADFRQAPPNVDIYSQHARITDNATSTSTIGIPKGLAKLPTSALNAEQLLRQSLMQLHHPEAHLINGVSGAIKDQSHSEQPLLNMSAVDGHKTDVTPAKKARKKRDSPSKTPKPAKMPKARHTDDPIFKAVASSQQISAQNLESFSTLCTSFVTSLRPELEPDGTVRPGLPSWRSGKVNLNAYVERMSAVVAKQASRSRKRKTLIATTTEGGSSSGPDLLAKLASPADFSLSTAEVVQQSVELAKPLGICGDSQTTITSIASSSASGGAGLCNGGNNVACSGRLWALPKMPKLPQKLESIAGLKLGSSPPGGVGSVGIQVAEIPFQMKSPVKQVKDESDPSAQVHNGSSSTTLVSSDGSKDLCQVWLKAFGGSGKEQSESVGSAQHEPATNLVPTPTSTTPSIDQRKQARAQTNQQSTVSAEDVAKAELEAERAKIESADHLFNGPTEALRSSKPSFGSTASGLHEAAFDGANNWQRATEIFLDQTCRRPQFLRDVKSLHAPDVVLSPKFSSPSDLTQTDTAIKTETAIATDLNTKESTTPVLMAKRQRRTSSSNTNLSSDTSASTSYHQDQQSATSVGSRMYKIVSYKAASGLQTHHKLTSPSIVTVAPPSAVNEVACVANSGKVEPSELDGCGEGLKKAVAVQAPAEELLCDLLPTPGMASLSYLAADGNAEGNHHDRSIADLSPMDFSQIFFTHFRPSTILHYIDSLMTNAADDGEDRAMCLVTPRRQMRLAVDQWANLRKSVVANAAKSAAVSSSRKQTSIREVFGADATPALMKIVQRRRKWIAKQNKMAKSKKSDGGTPGKSKVQVKREEATEIGMSESPANATVDSRKCDDNKHEATVVDDDENVALSVVMGGSSKSIDVPPPSEMSKSAVEELQQALQTSVLELLDDNHETWSSRAVIQGLVIWEPVVQPPASTPTSTTNGDATATPLITGKRALCKRSVKKRQPGPEFSTPGKRGAGLSTSWSTNEAANSVVDLTTSLDVVRYTIDQVAADVKGWYINRNAGETQLHRAARNGFVDGAAYAILQTGLDLNVKDHAGVTPLHKAAFRGHTEVVRLLLTAGADANASVHGARPLHDAVDSLRLEIVHLLLSYGADPFIRDYSGRRPIDLVKSSETCGADSISSDSKTDSWLQRPNRSISHYLPHVMVDLYGDLDGDLTHKQGTTSRVDDDVWSVSHGPLVVTPESTDLDKNESVTFAFDSTSFQLPDIFVIESKHVEDDKGDGRRGPDLQFSGEYMLASEVIKLADSDECMSRLGKKVLTLDSELFFNVAHLTTVGSVPDLGRMLKEKKDHIDLIAYDDELRHLLQVTVCTI